MFDVGSNILLAIFCMGLATYTSRLAGYWLLRGKPVTGRAKAAMDAVPPAILTAVIAPTVFLQGPAEMLAGAVTLASALMRMPLLITILVGVGSVAGLRLVM
jgi:uncharacterized membrane protein